MICGLWSLWTSESASAWLSLWQFALVPPTAGGWALIAFTVVASSVARRSWLAIQGASNGARCRSCPNRLARLVGMFVLLAASTTFARIHGGLPGRLIASAKTGDLNQMEMAQMERGYYENLLDVNRFNGELWNLYSHRPVECSTNSVDAGIAQRTSNFVRVELKPSVEAKYRGVVVKTNHWGMHDEECAQKRPAGCYRIALLGDSHVMATGVDRANDFETLVESRLNRENTNGQISSYEILNFAFEGYAPNIQVWVLENKALGFEPNAVFLVGHPDDEKRAIYHIVQLVREGIEPAFPFVRGIIERANVNKDTPDPIVRRRLAPFGEELMNWSLRRVVEICNEHGIRPVYVLVPEVTLASDGIVECQRAEKAGFTVLNLADVYEGRARKGLYLSPWDTHPNVTGHQLLAERLYGLIREKKIIPLSTETTGK